MGARAWMLAEFPWPCEKTGASRAAPDALLSASFRSYFFRSLFLSQASISSVHPRFLCCPCHGVVLLRTYTCAGRLAAEHVRTVRPTWPRWAPLAGSRTSTSTRTYAWCIIHHLRINYSSLLNSFLFFSFLSRSSALLIKEEPIKSIWRRSTTYVFARSLAQLQFFSLSRDRSRAKSLTRSIALSSIASWLIIIYYSTSHHACMPPKVHHACFIISVSKLVKDK
jgi:hypothetical protein